MRRSTFSYILELIYEDINPKVTNCNKQIDAEDRLFVTLRYLITGVSFAQLAYSSRISKSCISYIVKSVCTAIWNAAAHIHMPKPNKNDWEKISQEFLLQSGFPNCIGAIDGKHIYIKSPPNSGSQFYNYKHRFSINLLALTDINRRFIYIDVGAYGKQSDGGVFRNSSLYRELINHTLDMPAPKPFPGCNEAMPFVMVGDDAFPLSNYLMKPYPKRNLTTEEREYNMRLCHARVSVERSFGGIVKKFDILSKPIEIGLPSIEIVIKAICILHNIIINKEGSASIDDIDPTLANLTTRPFLASRENNSSSQESKIIRDKFKNFINS
ncbi:uncharacterized protein LOC135930836 [Gordionus sp. m RMFG-2023]|uniref:uncharacterized protein LOC135930836 n=1 Tax=Gordionus sp. m RMFG-2023 TaxID=3053472 RepID=UPI0031FBF7CB